MPVTEPGRLNQPAHSGIRWWRHAWLALHLPAHLRCYADDAHGAYWLLRMVLLEKEQDCSRFPCLVNWVGVGMDISHAMIVAFFASGYMDNVAMPPKTWKEC